jgi:hypothetical protein
MEPPMLPQRRDPPSPPRSVEIVITRYDEPLDWAVGLEPMCIVYNKGPTPAPPEFESVQVPNCGADVETVLRYCIERYETLPVMTFFCQGRMNDRPDQQCQPIPWYLTNPDPKALRCNAVLADVSPKWRALKRLSSPDCRAIRERSIGEFRSQVVGVSYRQGREYWVRGNWMTVGRDRIRSHPKAYYEEIYAACKFHRGIFTEELFFMERTYFVLFSMKFPKKGENVNRSIC